jgi:hypothetical protein
MDEAGFELHVFILGSYGPKLTICSVGVPILNLIEISSVISEIKHMDWRDLLV